MEVKVPTGIRVEIRSWLVVGLYAENGLGFKYRLQLNNTVGVIDSDYFHSDNEGHIFAKVINDSRQKKNVFIAKGGSFIQGILLPTGFLMTT